MAPIHGSVLEQIIVPTPILWWVAVLIIVQLTSGGVAWDQEAQPKIYARYGQVPGARFIGNDTLGEHFVVLRQDEGSVLIGARNAVYNISLYDLTENKEQRIEWPSTGAHRELCYLKGKSESECQNYIRVLARTSESSETPSGEVGDNATVGDELLVCGTNSYKPLCRLYSPDATAPGGRKMTKEYEGRGLCPFDPKHNSTAVYVDGHLFTATVADFSGGDPLVYRAPLRTERSDLKQLNQPEFVRAHPTDQHVLFFFRETAVEYMNCGKAVYSRVARVCRNDKGGPHQFGDRWTSFLKARLNCSVPGEYPFYFDEIQSVSNIVEGTYNSQGQSLLYGVFTTPLNAIGGSAICAFSIRDLENSFDGPFKDQPSINANWLPVPSDKVPEPRPGSCVPDSRTLPDIAVNFVKAHTLMEETVPAFFSRPVLTRVSMQYRFTTVAVEPQVRAMNGKTYDILYIGTDDGRVIKCLNTLAPDSLSTTSPVVVSEVQILPPGKAVSGIRVAPQTQSLIVVGSELVISAPLHHCRNVTSCKECVGLQDPHCAWDNKEQICSALTDHPYPMADRFLQDVVRGISDVCNRGWSRTPSPNVVRPPPAPPTHGTVGGVGLGTTELDNNVEIRQLNDNTLAEAASKEIEAAPSQPEDIIYTAQTMQAVVLASCLCTLAAGFLAGFLFSRRLRTHGAYSEAHNHLNRHLEASLTAQCSQYVAPPNNKTSNIPSNINLLKNVSSNKQDNLQHELAKHSECKNSTESLDNMGTLQKVKKTYI